MSHFVFLSSQSELFYLQPVQSPTPETTSTPSVLTASDAEATPTTTEAGPEAPVLVPTSSSPDANAPEATEILTLPTLGTPNAEPTPTTPNVNPDAPQVFTTPLTVFAFPPVDVNSPPIDDWFDDEAPPWTLERPPSRTYSAPGDIADIDWDDLDDPSIIGRGRSFSF